jgi:hypothetical protein
LSHPKRLLPSPTVLPSEPVSPELVLVDPELARVERARLEEKAYLESLRDVDVLRRAVESIAAPPDDLVRRPRWRGAGELARERLLPAALLCSMLANGFLVAEVVTRQGSQNATPVAARVIKSTQESSALLQRKRETQERAPATKGTVERRVASLILSAPAGKLPRRLVDPATGLVRNNVHVVCRGGRPRVFLCAVRLPSDGAKQGLFVRYRTPADGRGLFTWYGSRPLRW